MKYKRLLVAAAALALASQTAVHAHRVWLLPSTTILSGKDQWISVEAAVSNDLFFPNHRPVNLAQIEVIAPNGSPVAITNSVAGQIRSSFEVLLEQQGTYRIGLRPGGGRGPAPKAGELFGSWTDNGQPKRWTGTAESLASEKMAEKPGFKLRGTGGRKVVTFVTCGQPSKEVLKPEGKDFEIDFISHPNDLFANEPAKFRFLMDGKPAKDTEVLVVRGDDRFRNDKDGTTYKTDADGLVKIDWKKQPGRYWIQASSTVTSQLHGVPMEKSSSYILVLEVLPE